MIIVLRIQVDPATDRMQAECAEGMNLEQIGQVVATAALTYSTMTPGVSPRDVIERALRVLLDNPDAVGERSNIILPGRST